MAHACVQTVRLSTARVATVPHPPSFPIELPASDPLSRDSYPGADLYNILINMFLAPTDTLCTSECEPGVEGCPESGKRAQCPENDLFDGQSTLQNFLVLVAFVSIPIMLFAKPCVLRSRYMKANQVGDGAYRVDALEVATIAVATAPALRVCS